jgi:sialate O-acetylesterase
MKSLPLLMLLFGVLDAAADVRLPRLVSDNMVLQRAMPLKLWGWADPGEQVQIRFRGHSATTKTDTNGQWQITLAPQKAGGPDDLIVTGNNSLTLKNVLVGDVWLASGQSNMQFPLSGESGFGGIVNADAEISSANFPQIRLFLVKQTIALQPATDVAATGWSAVTPQTVRNFSAVAYLFGRELQQRYHVPIGLIDSSWGGTPAETWISDAAMRRFPEFAGSLQRRAQIDAAAISSYDNYLATRNAWYAQHGHEDRGRVDGHDVWASAEFDASAWPTTLVPQPWPVKAIKDFDGTLWLRKQIEIPPDQIGTPLQLHLSKMLQQDITYFNGHKIGETNGDTHARDYTAPPEYVHAGNNVITVRLAGQYRSGDGFVGMHGDATQMYAQIGSLTIPLSGTWSFQPGPDLSALPAPPPLAEFHTQFPQSPTLLFNAMIAPLTPYAIKGVIWYQGESNAGRPMQYRTLFPALINDWRNAWGQQLPFLFVQLAGYGADQPDPADYGWAELREAQAMTLALPNTGMACTIDIGDANDIHPKNKQDVAHRLALAAAKVAYHENIVSSGPAYQSMQLNGSRVRLKFANARSGLIVKGDAKIKGFAIAGADGKFVWANAQLAGNEIIVFSDAVLKPVAVRYNWGNTPAGNVYNREGLPAVPFRTDIH